MKKYSVYTLMPGADEQGLENLLNEGWSIERADVVPGYEGETLYQRGSIVYVLSKNKEIPTYTPKEGEPGANES